MLLHDHEKLDGHATGSFHAGLSLLGGRPADIKVAGKTGWLTLHLVPKASPDNCIESRTAACYRLDSKAASTSGHWRAERAMAEQTLKDRNGNKVGSIETRPDGTQIGKDRSGNKRGEYNPRANTTRDKNGNVFGQGNLLSTLITRP
jgi:hypothetical protein